MRAVLLVVLAGCDLSFSSKTSPPGDDVAVDANPDGLDAPRDTPTFGCPTNYAAVTGLTHLYKLRNNAQSWQQHRDACTADSTSAHLVIPDNQNELTQLQALTVAQTWLGVNDLVSEGTYQNVLGQPQTFLPWASGQPNGGANENCVYVNGNALFDGICSDPRVAICECTP